MKKHPGGNLVHFSAIGMELCWLQAWCEFLLWSIFKYQVPFLFTLVVFFGSIITTSFIQLKNRMRIQAWFIHLAIFSMCTFIAAHFLIFLPNNIPGQWDIKQLIYANMGMMDLLLILVIIVISLVIWKRGAVSVADPLGRENMYNRFDLGLSAFAILLVLRMILLFRFEILIDKPILEFHYLPFFLFGLLSMGAVLVSNKSNKYYASGFHKIGIALGLSFVVLTAGSGVVLLFNSQLTSIAEIFSTPIKNSSAPLEQILVSIFRFIWRYKQMNVQLSPPDKGEHGSGFMGQKSESIFFEEIIMWSLVGLLVLLVLAVLYFVLRVILRYLFSATERVPRTKARPLNLTDWFIRTIIMVKILLVKILYPFKSPVSACDFYLVLKKWGRFSGITLEPSETPQEYCDRLVYNFPVLEKEFIFLTKLVNRSIFGNLSITRQQIKEVKISCRRLSHPTHWPKRLKTLILSNGPSIEHISEK
jgi:hypothetical protein